MLRSFFLELVILIPLVGFGDPAYAVLFMAPNADSTGFQKYALQSNQQTYTQWLLEKGARTGPEAHPQVLIFSQQALKAGTTKQIMSDWELIRLNIDLNPADREILFLLAEKLHQKNELCRYSLLDAELLGLLENPQSLSGCEQKSLPIPVSIKTLLKTQDLLVIDGKIFSYDQVPQRLMPGAYQWKVLSNQFKDQVFQGSAYNFAKNRSATEHWVQGDCKNYKLDHQDFAVNVQAKIYFSDSCTPPGLPPERTFRDWAHEHKTLLWGLGIIATGLAASQLRNKTLVFTKP